MNIQKIFDKSKLVESGLILMCVIFIILFEFYFLNEIINGVIFFIFIITILSVSIDKRIRKIIVFAFVLRSVVVFINHQFLLFPAKLIEPIYNSNIITLVESWKMGILSSPEITWDITRILFIYVQAPFYFIFGSEWLIGKLVNALLGSIGVYNIYRITRVLSDNNRIAYIAAIIAATWPSYIYMHGVLQRDPLIFLLSTEFIYLGIIWGKHGKIGSLLSLIVVTFMLSTLRTAYIPLLVLALIVPVILNLYMYRTDKIQILLKPAYFTVGLFFVFAFIYVGNTGEFIRMGDKATPFSPDYFQVYYEHRQHGGSAYLTGLKYDRWFDLIKYAPIKAFYFLYVPFPWMIDNTEALFASIDASLLLLLSFPAVLGIKEALKIDKYSTLFVLAFFSVGIVASGLITSNAGAAFRYRMPFIFIIMIFSSYVISKVKVKM